MTAELIDTHCHLDFDKYDGELDEILARATAAGVTQMITIGCAQSVEDAGRALALAERHPTLLHATTGIHPHDGERSSDALLAEVERLAHHPRVVAIGEMGLDFHYDNSPRDAQRDSFRAQIAIARRVKKPIVVHTRDAGDETLAILRDEGARDVGGIIHCFSEDASFAKAALDLGFVSSFSGLVTFPRGTDAIRDAARTQPADAILVETDAPFLAPIPFRGRRNEPSYVAHTAAFIAALRGDDVDAFRELTTANARRIFSL